MLNPVHLHDCSKLWPSMTISSVEVRQCLFACPTGFPESRTAE